MSRVRLPHPRAAFAEKLAAPFDLFVNDAFGTAHRAHGSTEGVTKFLSPSVAGFLLQKELDYLEGAVKEPKRPFAAIVGGSKVSSKIGELTLVILYRTWCNSVVLLCVGLLARSRQGPREFVKYATFWDMAQQFPFAYVGAFFLGGIWVRL